MKKTATLFVMIALITCTLQAQNLPKGATKEIKNRVEIINNIDTPLYPNKKIKLVEDLSIGGKVKNGEDPKGELLNLDGFYIDIIENIFAYEENQKIKIFNKNGKYLTSIGGEGSGPGETIMVDGIKVSLDEEIKVFDLGGRKINIFSKEFKFLRSLPFRLIYSYKSLAFLRDSTVVNASIKKNQLTFKKYDFKGKEMQLMYSVDLMETKENEIHFEYDTIVFDEDEKNELLYIADQTEFKVTIINPKGDIKKIIKKPYKKNKISEEDKVKYSEFVSKMSSIYKKKYIPKIGEFHRAISSIIIDDSGKIWVKTSEVKTKQENKYNLWEIFNSEGIFEFKIWIPEKISPMQNKIIKNKIYTSYSNDDGERFIKRYKFSIE